MPEQQTEYLSTDPGAGQVMRPAAPPPSGFRLFVSPSQEAREKGLKTDYDRPDNSLLGMPPEALVVPAAGVGRAVAGASGLVGRGVAGAKAIGEGVVAPYVKYSAVKHALQSVGVPGPVAEAIAVGASGYRRGAKPTATTAAAEAEAGIAAPSVPPASSPAAPAPSAAPSAVARPPAQPVTRALSPQRIQNDLGIQARRQSVTLTEPQYKAATELVQRGASPADAVAEVARRTAVAPTAQTQAPNAPSPAQTAPAPKKASARARLTADEADEYLRLTGKGMSHEEAVEALLAQRKLASKLGTPDPGTVRRRVAEMNQTGKWPQ